MEMFITNSSLLNKKKYVSNTIELTVIKRYAAKRFLHSPLGWLL